MQYTLKHFKESVERQPTKWLQGCLSQRSGNWRNIHIAIIQNELRKRGALN